MHRLEYIEGIGKIYAEKLHKIGINYDRQLLRLGAKRTGRRKIAKQSGISPKLILKWINHADLIRIKGIGEEYSDLLEYAGVDTVIELSHRNPQLLWKELRKVNAERRLVRHVPSLQQVYDWIEQARKLPRVIEY